MEGANPTSSANKVKVLIRVRPLIGEEMYEDPKAKKLAVKAFTDYKRVALVKEYSDDREFIFDHVFPMRTTQEELFNIASKSTVIDVLNGFNGTIMAYGQTGSGKTHTIFGSRDSIQNDEYSSVHNNSGIVSRAAASIFEHIQKNISEKQFQVTISFMEIYMEMISDLLAPKSQAQKNLQIREDPKTGIFVYGLTQRKVTSVEEILKYIRKGAKNRFTSSTIMNKSSSRSHAILQIFVEQRYVEDDGKIKKRHHKRGLMTIVDLAGSERLSRTKSEGLRLEEAKTINKSISALGNCIFALASGKAHQFVPFRDSKLTRLLTDSLQGNSKTTLICCISPSLIQYDESYYTLLFGTRAMAISTYATINEEIDIKALQNADSEKREYENKELNAISYSYTLLQNQNDDLKSQINALRNQINQSTPNIANVIGRNDSMQNHSYSQISHSSSNFSRPMNSHRSLTPPPMTRNQLPSYSHSIPQKIHSIGNIKQFPTQNYPNHYASYGFPMNKGAQFSSYNSEINQFEMDDVSYEERGNKIAKKFANVISYLQNELAQKNLLIQRLQEENFTLKKEIYGNESFHNTSHISKQTNLNSESELQKSINDLEQQIDYKLPNKNAQVIDKIIDGIIKSPKMKKRFNQRLNGEAVDSFC